ncbi:small heat shock protein HspD [Labrys miyagiensis]|uniref:Small heat shock protein HspD n=1 Tax=Labrys miyagiensis TaxID=346912 RepID=A0ABQ6CJW5_9HYPH|nr:Hsp20 family protein [Labrys miyagiensis]GLS20578.1 small heat shock protein HspD [Labrys miyagiensis]
MRTYDFTPFARSAIGFDRLFDLLNAGSKEPIEGHPPYDIIRTGEDSFRITLAVAGFKPNDLTVTAQQNLLTVTGRNTEAKNGPEYIYQGISVAPFERRFDLADYVEVDHAKFENGLLHIDLAHRIPEVMKPRRVEIRSSAPAGHGKAAKAA